MVALNLKNLSRKWYVGVETAADTYTRVNGVTDVSYDVDVEEVDVTDQEDDGATARYAGARTGSVTITGYRVQAGTGSTISLDPGQERMDILGKGIGPENASFTAAIDDATAPGSIGKFQITHPVTGVTDTFQGYVEAPLFGPGTGGSYNDPMGWEATIMLTGKVTHVRP